MSVHKKGSKYQVRWLEGTRHRGRNFDRKADAQAFETMIRRKRQLGQEVPIMGDDLTLEQFFAKWLAQKHNLAKRTATHYQSWFESHVLEQIGFMPLRSITPQTLDDWQAERLASGAGPAAIAKTTKVLRQVFRRAEQNNLVNRSPAVYLELPSTTKKEKRPATAEQVEEIRNWFLERDRRRDAVMVSLMGYGGLRVGEALAMEWPNFIRGELLWVCQALEADGEIKETKTGQSREVHLPEPVQSDLLAWRTDEPPKGKLMFPRRDGNPWTSTDLNNWRRRHFSKAASQAGLENFSPKDLRMTAASLRIIAGERTTEIAEALGHTHAVSVQVYQRLIPFYRGRPSKPLAKLILEARAQPERNSDSETMPNEAQRERAI